MDCLIVMLASYIDQAMELAVYEIIADDQTYWGEIPGLQGVWANHQTLAGCRRELREALSDWLALRLRLGLTIPVIAGITRFPPEEYLFLTAEAQRAQREE